MKQHINQAGFSALEGLLIVFVIAAAGFVSYYVYNSNSKATDTYDSANNTSAQPIIRTKKTAAPATATAGSNALDSAVQAANPDDSQTTSDTNTANNSLTVNDQDQ